MDKRYEPLFTPWKVGNLEIKNRFVLCPMEGTNIIEWHTKTCFNENIWQFYRDRAKDGIGLMIPGAVPVRSIVGNKWLYKNPKVFEEVKEYMDEMHSYGSKVFFQLTLGPGRSMPLPKLFQKILDKKWLCAILKPFVGIDAWMVAPDEDLPNVWNPNYKHRALTKKEILEYIYALGQTAKLCKEAGVDGVEIHAMHEGYLIDQFTMPYTNHRDDEFGGSFEGRMRLPAEIVKEIKKVCGQDYPVSLRYSVTSKTKGFNQGAVPGEEFVEVGRTMEESRKAIAYLNEAGYDLFNSDNGTYDAWYWAHPPTYAPLNTNLNECIEIKPYSKAPVICAGRMQPEDAAKAIAAGQIDAMGIGRQFLCDNEYITKIREDRMEDIRPCISCHASCLPLARHNYEGCEFDLMNIIMGRCALNPYTMEEKHYNLEPTTKPKRISIVGGGIAGMEVAIQAMKRGHKVDLYEKTNKLGGVFNAAAAPNYKEKDRELLEWYERQLKKSGANVHMDTEIKDISKLDADEIVICTGANAKKLNCIGGERVVPAIDYLYRNEKIGDKVVVIGGALTGCEIAYELALEGKQPQVIEMLSDLICTPGVSMANSQMLRDLLAFHEVPVYLESTVQEIKENSVIIETKDGLKEIEADTVIGCVGYSPGTPLAAKSNGNVHIIGDAEKVGNLKTVIKEAYDLVQKLSY